jgi:ligand-binding sensor domain-containing protein
MCDDHEIRKGMCMNRRAVIRCWCLVFIAASGWCASISAQESKHGPGTFERGGWIESGTTVPFPPGRVRAGRTPTGVLTDFGTARRLRTLLCAEDTLWIGTEGGLFAYVPESDTLFEVDVPLCGPVRSIAVDDDGGLWVGGDNGISVRANGLWIHYGPQQHRLFDRVTEIVPGDGRVWVGSYGNGCGYITADSIRSFSRSDSLLDDRILAIVEESAHKFWFGTASGLCMTDTLHWESMRYGSGIPIGPVADIIFDESGDLFLAVTRQGVARYSLGRVRTFGPRDGLPGREINAFSLDPNGRVWAAGSGGVSVYDGSGWVPYRPAELPLPLYNFLSACHDLEGRCYLGTDSGALLVLARERAREIRVPQRFPDPQVIKIHLFDGNVWFLTGRRIYRLRPDLEEFVPPDDWYIGAMSDFVVDAAGGVWVASRFGILHHTGGEWEVFDRRQGLPTEHFVSAARGKDGDIWFGTFDRGILRLTAGAWIHYMGSTGLPDERIIDLVIDGGGSPWVLTGEGGLARFRGNTWERIPLPQWREESETARRAEDTTGAFDPAIRFLTPFGGRYTGGIPFPHLRLGLDAAGHCIVAVLEGIYQFTESGWRVISGPAWESGVDPTAVLVARNGSVWLGTERSGVFVREHRDWMQLGTAHGLTDNHILSIAEDSDGNVWIGTQYGGLNRFKPGETF